MDSRVNEAENRKRNGYNCAQAVACTYCDLAGIDEDTMKNLMQGFAVGMGGSMEGTCGALVGATSVLGMINRNPQKTVKATREMMQDFLEQNGTAVCKELKGINDGIVKRECIDCVKDAACLLEKSFLTE
ncbi:MAG: C-GCAxxG-C-C family protein [Lachnospiraceae bacterium]|nr:C-GCAxxG-C-C family protein [Lachnospiraceae bacterium]